MATDPLDSAWDSGSGAQASPANPLSQSQPAAAAAPAASSLDASWQDTQTQKPEGTPQASSASNIASNLGVAPSTAAAPPSTGPSTGYGAGIAAAQSATDPQDLLAKQDQLARSVMSNLQAAGHDVSWDGTHLTVDGRPYEVAGQNAPMSSVAGFVDSKLQDPNYSSAKYTPAAKTFAQALSATGLDPSTARGHLDPIAIYAQMNGFPGAHAVGDDKIDFGDGNGPIDVLTVDGSFWFQNGSDRAGGGGADGSGGGAGTGTGTDAGASLLASVSDTLGQRPDYNSMWSISPGSTYTPSAIGNENMPGFTYESLLADQANNGNPTQGQTDRNVGSLLDNPDSVSQHTVDMMEAQDAEQQMAANQQNDTALKRFGLQGGISDSPWLASERAAGARSTDAAIIGNRRNIELTAAQTNKADERAAAQIGMTYQGQRSQQQIASVANAVDGAMKKAVETSNRFSINENLKVEAAKLSISVDQLREQYVNDTLQDMTKRYGIDLGVKVDAAKLSQQGEQFQNDLLYKLSALKQNDDQFGATLGLNYDTLNANEMDKYWTGATA